MFGLTKEKKDVYVYFDNDQDAYAAFNALTLKRFISAQSYKHLAIIVNFCAPYKGLEFAISVLIPSFIINTKLFFNQLKIYQQKQL